MLIYQDAKLRPSLFFWNGGIEPERLENWLKERQLEIPRDLHEFWMMTGGGDIFESETILGPFGDSAMQDDVDSVNQIYHHKGLPMNYLIIHVGLGGLTAVSLLDQQYVSLDEEHYQEFNRYKNLEDWCRYLIRAEYADRYGLEPA